MKLVIINGPNLNLVGLREPDIYGNTSLEEYLNSLVQQSRGKAEVSLFQSNSEGTLIDFIQGLAFTPDGTPVVDKPAGLIINAGAYTHTSVALADCLKAVQIPYLEVHISNVHARESFRHISYLSAAATGVIAGLGLAGYQIAVDWFCEGLQ